jgi:hypothetical protein
MMLSTNQYLEEVSEYNSFISEGQEPMPPTNPTPKTTKKRTFYEWILSLFSCRIFTRRQFSNESSFSEYIYDNCEDLDPENNPLIENKKLWRILQEEGIV